MWPFKKSVTKLNVGKATIQITFTDNSSELKEVYGDATTPAKYVARAFLRSAPRTDWQVITAEGNKMIFKDAKCLEITKLEDYFIEVEK